VPQFHDLPLVFDSKSTPLQMSTTDSILTTAGLRSKWLPALISCLHAPCAPQTLGARPWCDCIMPLNGNSNAGSNTSNTTTGAVRDPQSLLNFSHSPFCPRMIGRYEYRDDMRKAEAARAAIENSVNKSAPTADEKNKEGQPLACAPKSQQPGEHSAR
jgi:hypothetical protein